MFRDFWLYRTLLVHLGFLSAVVFVGVLVVLNFTPLRVGIQRALLRHGWSGVYAVLLFLSFVVGLVGLGCWCDLHVLGDFSAVVAATFGVEPVVAAFIMACAA